MGFRRKKVRVGSRRRRGIRACLVGLAAAYLALGTSPTIQSARAEDTDFFEKRIRPILADHCLKCHADGDENESGLRLDSTSGLLKGGSRGPAVDPGDPSASLLLRAVRYNDPDLKMPPTRKLDTDEIGWLEQWVNQGARIPESAVPTGAASAADHWAFRPVVDPPVPDTADPWPIAPVDQFVLAAMKRAGVRPAPSADKATLLRRVTFDLTGLPPTPAELEAFLADDSSDAFAKVVDRLLASPAYGERWGRHWLDIVRFAETNGFDSDSEKPNAFRYRDYVIEAFNEDVSYREFIREQIAGDLLPNPRLSKDGTHAAAPLGTGIYWFGEILQLPFDNMAAATQNALELEGQIDMLGKAFLGLTIACARCHDHKFDPITKEDYYALAGYVTSTTNVQACVDTPDHGRLVAERWQELVAVDRQLASLFQRPAVKATVDAERKEEARRIAAYLLGAAEIGLAPPEDRGRVFQEAAASWGCNPDRLGLWALTLFIRPDYRGIFAPFVALARAPPDRFSSELADYQARLERMRQFDRKMAAERIPFADFEGTDFGDWKAVGQAFSDRPMLARDSDAAGITGDGFASSYRSTNALTGRLLSPSFVVDPARRFLCFWMAGGAHPRTTCVNVIVHSQIMPQLLPIWTATGNNTDEMVLHVLDLQLFTGREVFIEVVDDEKGDWGHIMVDEFFFTDEAPPAGYIPHNSLIASALDGVASLEDLAERYAELFLQALSSSETAADSAALEDWNAFCRYANVPGSLIEPGLEAIVTRMSDGDREEFIKLVQRRDEREGVFPDSITAIVARDHRPADSRIHVRGDGNNLGPTVPRRPPALLCSDGVPASPGSGRLALADWIASPTNPLTARVMVNRIWRQHFHAGLVATPDNFGLRGEKPSQPELLDFLASRFVESGWSIKALHRLLFLSSTYQQSSQADPRYLAIDPENRWLHHFPIRRLDAESLRDAMLLLGGSLDRQHLGPSVKLAIADEEADEPVATPGLHEGEGRRSVYIEVRRNHTPRLFDLFDFPKMPWPVVERKASVTPEQMLFLLNSEFVNTQAERWAARMLAEEAGEPERIERLYLEALARLPTLAERVTAQKFLADQRALLAQLGSDPARPEPNALDPEKGAWAGLCHVLLNHNEFLFTR